MSHSKNAKPDGLRRTLLKACGSIAAFGGLAPMLANAGEQTYESFERTLLIDSDGNPLDLDKIPMSTELIFYYPYVSTPCFLLQLDQALETPESLETNDGSQYVWQGGVGPEKRLVAYSAICAHKMSHPSPTISFIGYRRDLPDSLARKPNSLGESGVIQCCSEHSVYDPARGARVLSGPAPQPLAAINLEVDDNKIYATGVWGGQMFSKFMDAFGMRVQMEMNIQDISQLSGETSVVQKGETLSRQRIICG